MPSVGNQITTNISTREVQVSQKPISLTPAEYSLLVDMVRHEGGVLARSALMEKVSDSEHANAPRFAEIYTRRLRSKLESNSTKPRLIVPEQEVDNELAERS